MAPNKLTMYVDIVSPFAYLAFEYLQKSKVFKGVEVTYIPVFLGGIMKATDNRPPLAIKNKAKWINLERQRLAKRFDIPIAATVPEGFPTNTVNVERALVAVQSAFPEQLTPSIAALYKAYWLERKSIADINVYGGVLKDVLGTEKGEKVLTMAQSQEIKDKLSAQTNEAVEQGAFGLPYFLATNSDGKTEGFWGFEHLALAAEHLGLEKERAML